MLHFHQMKFVVVLMMMVMELQIIKMHVQMKLAIVLMVVMMMRTVMEFQMIKTTVQALEIQTKQISIMMVQEMYVQMLTVTDITIVLINAHQKLQLQVVTDALHHNLLILMVTE